MHKIIYISVLISILSLLSVCTPEQTDIIVPKQIKPEGNQKIIITNANNAAFRIFKTKHKISTGNIIISPLNNNSVLSFILSFYDISNQTTNNELNKELKAFNELILNLDKNFIINEQTVLNFNKTFEFQANFTHFLEDNLHYKIKFTNNQTTYKNIPFVKIENNLNAKFTYSSQTNIGEAPFYLSPDKSKFVEMMICVDAFNYYSDDYMKVVEVPIGQGNFSALFFIPETGFSLNRIINTLNPYILKTVQNNYRKLQMAVYIPKLNINNKLESNGENYYVNQINIKTLKLKNISKKESINIKNVVYKTSLKSISKIKHKKESYKSNSLFIDRPFIFIIQEKYTDAIVFIGQIVNP